MLSTYLLVECKLGNISQMKNEKIGKTTYKELSREQAGKLLTPKGDCHCVTCKSRRAFAGESAPIIPAPSRTNSF